VEALDFYPAFEGCDSRPLAPQQARLSGTGVIGLENSGNLPPEPSNRGFLPFLLQHEEHEEIKNTKKDLELNETMLFVLRT
jgi:hypothetical protein